MINLLPDSHKKEIRAGRTNHVLIRYTVLLLIAAAFIGVCLAVVFALMSHTRTNAEQAQEQNQQRFGEYQDAEQQATELRANLATAKQVLDSELTYTDSILAIAALMPRGTVLDDLRLNADSFGSATTIAANARDYDSALAMKESFEESTMFSNVHFQNISNNSDDSGGGYPIKVSLNVTLEKKN